MVSLKYTRSLSLSTIPCDQPLHHLAILEVCFFWLPPLARDGIPWPWNEDNGQCWAWNTCRKVRIYHHDIHDILITPIRSYHILSIMSNLSIQRHQPWLQSGPLCTASSYFVDSFHIISDMTPQQSNLQLEVFYDPKTHLSDTKGESIPTSTAFGGIINGLELHLEKPRENGRFKVFLPTCHRHPKLKEASIKHSRLESQDFRALFCYPCLPALLVLFELLRFSSFAVFFSPRSRFVLPNLLVCCFLSVICC